MSVLYTAYGGARRVYQTLDMARRTRGQEAGPLCSIVWAESPGRERALILPRRNSFAPTQRIPICNHLMLIGDVDTGEIELIALEKWLTARDRTSGWPSAWHRLYPDISDPFDPKQRLTLYAVRPRHQ